MVGSPVVKDVVGDLEEYLEKCRVFEMSNNILTETLLIISTMNNVEQSTHFNKTQFLDIGDPVVFL